MINLSEVKTIGVKLEWVNYTIQFKDTQPKETIVLGSRPRMGRKLH